MTNFSSTNGFVCLSIYAIVFILLENVVQRFRYPCIMDLKMGKWHQRFSVQDNISNHEMGLSTPKLGFRLGGMQVQLNL